MPSRVGYQPIGDQQDERLLTGHQQSNTNDAVQPTTFFPDQVLVQMVGTNNEHGQSNFNAPPGSQPAISSSAAATSRWSHIDNLDDFFTRVYEYHQRHGFVCMLLSHCFELFQFVFVVTFSSFLLECVDYGILFKNKNPQNFNATQSPPRKITLADAVRADCSSRFPGWLIVCLIIAATFWVYRLIRVIYQTTQAWEMHQFYTYVLNVPDSELENLTWHEIQRRLREAQNEHRLCIHKRELTELDIYQRILRRKNYLVAMVNKGLLPPKFVGASFFTNFFKLNLELLFFVSPWSAWENYWHLKPEYKRREKRQELTERMRRVLLYLGLLNLLLSPLIFVWQILYSFFFYAELIKREPGSLGARRWSIYGRYYFRHFNELDHELDARLCRAYRPAQYYMDMFTSSVGEIMAKNVAFFAGALCAVLVILSIYDEDVVQVEHVLAIITGLGLIIAFCKIFIPDENLVWCPEAMMQTILCHVHYLPDNWRGLAHTESVRAEFSQLFQYKATFLVEELLSALVTPFVLLFWLRPRAAEFIDFFRKFTVEVPGLGDVCSFAQMDVQKHGDPDWHPSNNVTKKPAVTIREPDDAAVPAEHGKTEMSLMHFAVTNPFWEPGPSQRFVDVVRREAQKDAQVLLEHQAFDNALLQSLGSIGVPPFHGLSNVPMFGGEHLKGRGVSKSEGPLSTSGALSSLNLGGDRPTTMNEPSMLASCRLALPRGAGLTETTAAEMSLNALYMHELRRRRLMPRNYGAAMQSIHNQHFRPMRSTEELNEDQAQSDLWTVGPDTNTPPQRPSSELLRLQTPDEDDEEDIPPHYFQPS